MLILCFQYKDGKFVKTNGKKELFVVVLYSTRYIPAALLL